MNSSITSSDGAWLRRWRYAVSFLLVAGVLSSATWIAVAPIAPQFTGNMSFDQKLKFVRDLPPDAMDDVTLVVGSSMALNNVNTNILDEALDRRFLNLGVWGMGVKDTHQLTRDFIGIADVREVILSVQFFEISDGMASSFSVPGVVLDDYVSSESPLSGFGYRDFYHSLRRMQKWQRDSGDPQSYTNVLFNRTGFVPLQVYGARIDPARWNPTQSFASACLHCLDDIQAMCHDLELRDMPFTIIVPPLSPWVQAHRPDVKVVYADRQARLTAMLPRCRATVFDAGVWADFEDSCFADFSHLNGEGARKLAQIYLAWRAGDTVLPKRAVACAKRSADAAAQESGQR